MTPPAGSCAGRHCIWRMRKEGVSLNVYGITDRGLVRKENQDCYDCWDQEDGSVWAVVCDGMGGAKSGNVASQLAVEIFSESVHRAQEDQPATVMNRALDEANEVVRKRSHVDPNCAGMGTTLVAACVLPDRHAYVLNVGDSRGYRIQPSGISQITRDHSLVADLVARGKITPEEARTHPNKNIITRALGTERHTVGDLFEVELEPGDFILLCSDGLSNVVTEQEILYEVLYGGGEETCCQRLLEIALLRGAPDNVTAVLICTDGVVVVNE